MIKEIEGVERVLFGTRRSDIRSIYISKPSFDCGWYWSFGYLGNKKEHYHLENYKQIDRHFKDEKGAYHFITENRNTNMFDCLETDYDLSENIAPHLWQFCELASTIYTLRKTAEIFYSGSSHYTTNQGKEYLKNDELYKLLTFTLIPKQCQTFWNLVCGIK